MQTSPELQLDISWRHDRQRRRRMRRRDQRAARAAAVNREPAVLMFRYRNGATRCVLTGYQSPGYLKRKSRYGPYASCFTFICYVQGFRLYSRNGTVLRVLHGPRDYD